MFKGYIFIKKMLSRQTLIHISVEVVIILFLIFIHFKKRNQDIKKFDIIRNEINILNETVAKQADTINFLIQTITDMKKERNEPPKRNVSFAEKNDVRYFEDEEKYPDPEVELRQPPPQIQVPTIHIFSPPPPQTEEVSEEPKIEVVDETQTKLMDEELKAELEELEED